MPQKRLGMIYRFHPIMHRNRFPPKIDYREKIERFPSRSRKKTEISMGAKVEFPIGKKVSHLVVNPGTSRCPTVDLELVQTTRNV